MAPRRRLVFCVRVAGTRGRRRVECFDRATRWYSAQGVPPPISRVVVSRGGRWRSLRHVAGPDMLLCTKYLATSENAVQAFIRDTTYIGALQHRTHLGIPYGSWYSSPRVYVAPVRVGLFVHKCVNATTRTVARVPRNSHSLLPRCIGVSCMHVRYIS